MRLLVLWDSTQKSSFSAWKSTHSTWKYVIKLVIDYAAFMWGRGPVRKLESGCYPVLRNSASGPEIGLLGRISTGF
jgi:hypothetical protein